VNLTSGLLGEAQTGFTNKKKKKSVQKNGEVCAGQKKVSQAGKNADSRGLGASEKKNSPKSKKRVRTVAEWLCWVPPKNASRTETFTAPPWKKKRSRGKGIRPQGGRIFLPKPQAEFNPRLKRHGNYSQTQLGKEKEENEGKVESKSEGCFGEFPPTSTSLRQKTHKVRKE